LPEVLASQDEMLRRRGKSDAISHDVMTKAFLDHLGEFEAWLKKRPDVLMYRQAYRKIIDDPVGTAGAVANFLGVNLNVEAMAVAVDPALYRNRRP
jgi:hypothetical protein